VSVRPNDPSDPHRYVPPAADVDALIAAATKHPLGIEFLLGGHLGTVAVMFHTHAFTVMAARDRLRHPPYIDRKES
jgi:hypothetical protein